jgi:hypothetical protein
MISNVNALPRSIIFSVAGLFGTVLLIVGAAVLRPPLDDEDSPAAAAAPAKAASAGARSRAAPVAVSVATAAPDTAKESASSAEPTASVPANTREARAKFIKDVQNRRTKDAVASLSQLLDIDPFAPKDSDVREAVVELAMRVMLLEGNETATVFNLISGHMGTTGADILYELVTTRGGSRAAKLAEEVLKNESVRERGTPALRIAYDLRKAKSCDDKIALLDRATADGDGRTFGQLQLVNRECSRRSSECCLRNHPKLKEALEAIRARSN